MEEYYIYKTTNIITKQIYVGKKKRQRSQGKHPTYLGSGTLIQQAIKEYGKENFTNEILQWCGSEEEANRQERFWIEQLHSLYTEGNYNMTKGGTGGSSVGEYCNFHHSRHNQDGENNPFYGKRHSEESKQKMSEKLKGKIPHNKGKKLTEEQKRSYGYYTRQFNLTCKECNQPFVGTAGSQLYCKRCKILKEIEQHMQAISTLTKQWAIQKRQTKIQQLKQELSDYDEHFKCLTTIEH